MGCNNTDDKKSIISLREHQIIRKLINRNMLGNLDPQSDEGRFVYTMAQRLYNDSDPTLPEEYKRILIEQLIFHILISRSAQNTMLKAKRPAPGVTPQADAQRKAWGLAMRATQSSGDQILKIIKMLSPRVEDDKPKTLTSVLKELVVAAEG